MQPCLSLPPKGPLKLATRVLVNVLGLRQALGVLGKENSALLAERATAKFTFELSQTVFRTTVTPLLKQLHKVRILTLK